MIVLTSDHESHLRLFSAASDATSLACEEAAAPDKAATAKPALIDPLDFQPQVEITESAQAGQRVESVLRAAAQLTDCQAAALYLLDDATSKLSLRHGFNLPADALVAPPRRLSESLADLEALAGSAVVLEDNSLYPYWRVPQANFGAAVCVPVANASTIVGTLWIFSEQARSFSSRDTHLVEIIAGRIAADLRYDALCLETVSSARLERQWADAAQRQRSLQRAPLAMAAGWEMAGWTSQAEGIGGAMFDWLCDERDHLKLMAGQAMERGLTAAIGAASLRSSLRLLSERSEHPAEILSEAGRAMWSVSAGDQFAAALVGSLDPFTGDLRYSAAGKMHAVLVGQGKNRRLTLDAPPLGVDPEWNFLGGKTNIARGATLAIMTPGASRLLGGPRRSAEANVAQVLRKFRHQSLAEQVTALGRAATAETPGFKRFDGAIIALRRPAHG